MQGLLEFVFSLISIPDIMALEWIVKGPGLALIAWNLFKFVTSIFSLRLFSAFWALVYAVIFAVVLSQFGGTIQAMILEKQAEQKEEQDSLMPASPQGFRLEI